MSVSLPLLEGASASESSAALQLLQPVRLETGEVLMEQGTFDPSLAVILEGEVEILRDGVVVGKAGAAEIVGASDLFTGRARLASVRTTGRTKLMALDRSGYDALVDMRNPVAWTVERQVCRSLATRYRALTTSIGGYPGGIVPPPVLIPRSEGGLLGRLLSLFGKKEELPQPVPIELDGVRLLDDTRPFGGSKPSALERLVRELEPLSLPSGHLLYQEATPASSLFVVVRGRIDRLVALRETTVARFHLMGSERDDVTVIGASALVDGLPHPESAVAVDPTAVFVLDRYGWEQAWAAESAVGSVLRTAVIRSLAEQVAAAMVTLVGLMATADLPRIEQTEIGLADDELIDDPEEMDTEPAPPERRAGG